MTLYHTINGSVYAVDRDQKKAKRLSGFNEPTKRTADWRSFEWAEVIAGQLVIQWTDDTPPLEDWGQPSIPATITSLVTKQEDCV